MELPREFPEEPLNYFSKQFEEELLKKFPEEFLIYFQENSRENSWGAEGLLCGTFDKTFGRNLKEVEKYIPLSPEFPKVLL